MKLNYINLPVLAKFYATDAFSIETGPQLGILLSGKGGYLPNSRSYRTLDFGLGFGLGYKITDKLELGVRYTIGFTDVTKTNTENLKNSVGQFTLGYSF
ncbi:Outer membrane protein beta-barrel domain-containing protein [Maribacter ulvicola]|uniref:Outer membrane protein beta-barrel domain-containing protein n=1 Tax=Maribacter ulvicola TaxID=228959 RepID=A0A1N6QWT5_9FLAO|nr:Outer membrane protein beta-barrel domain-containing protein [Maribacter ulvicola]